MWINEHPYLSLYFLGCVLVVILTLLKIILLWAVEWLTKANILNKNLKKLLPPDENTFGKKTTLFVGTLALEAALSWINVVVMLWQIITALLRTVRDVFSSAPEAIKLLRFPLKNNPNMSRESVWAYLLALQMKVGEKEPSESELLLALNDLFGHYPSFDRVAALKQLERLNVMDSDAIAATLGRLSSSDREI
jgi:ABC-type multidrug transport system fused ATPase/permease subunit